MTQLLFIMTGEFIHLTNCLYKINIEFNKH